MTNGREYDEKGIYNPPYLRDSDQLRQEMAEMQGAVSRYDSALGQILDTLDKHNVSEDTIVVSTTDHGIDFPCAKGTFYDRGIETLMLMRYPAGGWGRGRAIDELSSHIDLVPSQFLGLHPAQHGVALAREHERLWQLEQLVEGFQHRLVGDLAGAKHAGNDGQHGISQ